MLATAWLLLLNWFSNCFPVSVIGYSYTVDAITGGMLFIVAIGVVLGVVSGSFMLAVIFVVRHRYVAYIQVT